MSVETIRLRNFAPPPAQVAIPLASSIGAVAAAELEGGIILLTNRVFALEAGLGGDLNALIARVVTLEGQMSTLMTQVATLQSQVASLTGP